MQALFATLSLLPCTLYRALTCLNFTYGSPILSDSFVQQNLYNAHVRKVVVMGLAPIGCAPYYSWLYHSNNGQCATINDVIFCDAFEVSMDIIQNHDHYGFNVTDEACCGLGKYKGWILCISPEMACSKASNHIWWDQFHLTDVVNAILADNVCSSSHTPMW